MPVGLTRPEFGYLPGSPLELVVCQVRHDERSLDAASALAIQESLNLTSSGSFPRIEQIEVHTATMAVGAGVLNPAKPPDVARGWHLKSNDGGWTAALLNDQFSLETTKYTDWSQFVGYLRNFIDAIESHSPPTMEIRLGLRYVDRVAGLPIDQLSDWSKWIHPSLLGPPLHPVLGDGMTSTRQQVDLDLGDGRFAVLRHGTVSDPTGSGDAGPVYLLDFDLYRQQARRFASAKVMDTAEDLHGQADALFLEVITPDLLARLSGDKNV